MNWHDNAETRKAVGDNLEALFEKQVRCACGGHFAFIGDSYPGCPDFTCDNCGYLVDVKGSPQSKATGNIAVSEIPWSKYPPNLALVTRIDGRWIGEFKIYIRPENRRAFEPTHKSRHPTLGNTRFHLIAWRKFRPIAELDLVEM